VGKLGGVKLPAVLLGLFGVVFVVLAIGPSERLTWALENALALAGVVFLILTRKRWPLSNTAYVLVFTFTMLHEIGAHYTYTHVPYDAWCEAAFGTSLADSFGWERNHYDRLVHFAFGLFLAPAVRQLIVGITRVSPRVSLWFTLQSVISWSALYELVEWGAAVVFGGATAEAYVGMQGDVWDAQKDMALAAGGAFLSLAAVALSRLRRA
jgi:putative membrane protein